MAEQTHSTRGSGVGAIESVSQETRMFPPDAGPLNADVRSVLRLVHQALSEKGYRPVDQIVGYLISGDPAYITSHKQARLLLTRLDRNDVLEEVVRSYLSGLDDSTEH